MTEGNCQIVTLHMCKFVYVDKARKESAEDVKLDFKASVISVLQGRDVSTSGRSSAEADDHEVRPSNMPSLIVG